MGPHGITQNHVWTDEEVDEALAAPTHVKPVTLMDKVVYGVVRGAYHSFNFLPGGPLEPLLSSVP